MILNKAKTSLPCIISSGFEAALRTAAWEAKQSPKQSSLPVNGLMKDWHTSSCKLNSMTPNMKVD